MQRKNCLLLFVVFLFFTFSGYAQSTSVSDQPFENSGTNLLEINGENWTFYLDDENKVYYIDFETISVNLSDIKVRNEAGEIVLEDKLWDLPVNAIYELDLSKWKPGKYKVELRTYTGIIHKDLQLGD